VLALARQSDAVIYAMAFWAIRPAKKEEDEACSSGCARTGRRGVFSKDHQRNRGCIAQVAADLREQYTLGLLAEGRADARAFHRIEVEGHASPGGARSMCGRDPAISLLRVQRDEPHPSRGRTTRRACCS